MSYSRSTRQEIADDLAFQDTVMARMEWSPNQDEYSKTLVVGNARHAWNEALKWERTRHERD